MLRSCDHCGKQYQAERSTSRFCGTTCRVAAHMAQRAATHMAHPEAASEAAPGAVSEAVQRELEAAGQVSSALGVVVLSLAARIDVGQDSGSSLAALSRELRSALAAATADGVAADPVDEVRRVREQKLARARSSAG